MLAILAFVASSCGIFGKDTGDVSLVGEEEDEYTVEGATIEITSPVGSVYATDSIDIIVYHTGNPERIELLKDGEPFAVLPEGSTRYTWHVTTEVEKAYQVTAVASADDGSVESAPVEIIVDHTPPRIVSRTPEPGSKNVNLADPITIEFDEPLDPESVGDASVTLARKGVNLIIIQIPDADLETDAFLSEDRKSIDVQLTTRVTGPVTLKLTIDGVKDDAGNRISENSWDWAPGGWAPETEPIEGLIKPSLETNGTTLWVHGQRANGNFVIMERSSSSWTEMFEYEPQTAGSNRVLEFLMSRPTETAWVLFETGEQYEVVRYDLDDQVSEIVSEIPLDSRPGLAVDDSGDAFLAHDQGTGALTLSRWTTDGWEEVASVEPAGQPSDCHLSGSETLVLVARDQSTGQASFWEFDKTDWDVTDLPINPSDIPAMDARGEATGTHSVVVEGEEGDVSLQVREFDDEEAWPALLVNDENTMQERVNHDTDWEIRHPTLKVEPNGTVWLAWEEYESTRPSPVSRVHVRRWADDQWYARTHSLGMSPDDPTWTTHPDIELRAPDDPIVVYEMEQDTHVVRQNVFVP
jgi:hypothetical protein